MKNILFVLALVSSTTFALAQGTKKANSGVRSAATTPAATAVASSAPEEDKEKKDEFVNQLFTEQSYLNAQIVDKLFTFKFSPSCWAAFTSPTTPSGNSNDVGLRATSFMVQDVVRYAKREKIGDFMELAVDDKAVEKANRPMIDEMIKKMREKFSMVIEAPVECKGRAYEMLLRYPYQVLTRIGSTNPEWSPTSGEAHFTTTLSTTAKDMAVKISPDGKQFTITGPAYVEAYDTQSKIQKGLDRVNKNR